MSRGKIGKKSTFIDMTAMCDVAFLLLSFFILTAKFKPAQAIEVATPSSVASKPVPEKDATVISMDAKGKVFLSLDNEAIKAEMGQLMNTDLKLGLDATDLQKFVKVPFYGSSLSQLKSYLNLPTDGLKGDLLPGIPVDSTNNEFTTWMKYVVTAHAHLGTKLSLVLKGDNAARYPSFKQIITGFKKNDQFKFQMVTSSAEVPVGSALYKKIITQGDTNTQ